MIEIGNTSTEYAWLQGFDAVIDQAVTGNVTDPERVKRNLGIFDCGDSAHADMVVMLEGRYPASTFCSYSADAVTKRHLGVRLSTLDLVSQYVIPFTNGAEDAIQALGLSNPVSEPHHV